MLREILRELDDNLSETDLDNMIDEIDTDGSGTVDWEGNFSLRNIVTECKGYGLGPQLPRRI